MATDDPAEDEVVAKGKGDQHHALALGGIHHLYAGGHIDGATRTKLIQSVRKAMGKKKEDQQVNNKKMSAPVKPPPVTFGRLDAPIQPTKPLRSLIPEEE